MLQCMHKTVYLLVHVTFTWLFHSVHENVYMFVRVKNFKTEDVLRFVYELVTSCELVYLQFDAYVSLYVYVCICEGVYVS